MEELEHLKRGLLDAGCTEKASALISSLYESGNFKEMLRQMRKERCSLLERMHAIQRKVDCMDYLIHAQEKRIN